MIKKTIAREILFFLAILSITLLTYSVLLLKNKYHESKTENLLTEISTNKKIYDNLSIPYLNKIKNHKLLYAQFCVNLDTTKSDDKYNNPEKIWKFFVEIIKEDSLIYNKWDADLIENWKPIGLNTAKEFNSFIINNTYNKNDTINLNKSKLFLIKINEDRRNKNYHELNIMTSEDIWDFSKMVLIISILILFCIRYVIFIFIWCLKTIKN